MFAEVNNQTVVTYPYDYDTLVKKNPSTRFPQEDLLSMYQGTEDNLAGNELVRVVITDEPSYDRKSQAAVLNSQPNLVNGVWTLGWSIQSLSAEEQAEKQARQASIVRHDRNSRLSESDWTQGKDIPDSVSSAWATYRQALRDIPTQSGFPWEVTWPAKPE
jgi:hypothetical protein